jgi:hypothetical protein
MPALRFHISSSSTAELAMSASRAAGFGAKIMLRTISMGVLLALMAGSTLAAVPGASDVGAVRNNAAGVWVAQCARYGPYATAGRANQVAAEARASGYSAVVYPEWGAYYVNIC